MAESKSMRVAYGEALRDIGGLNEKVVVCDADLAHATMTNIFAEKYPERFFNFGIAEANMTCAAAGMAHSGLIPFISTFALFGTGRAYEQIRNSIAYVNANAFKRAEDHRRALRAHRPADARLSGAPLRDDRRRFV